MTDVELNVIRTWLRTVPWKQPSGEKRFAIETVTVLLAEVDRLRKLESLFDPVGLFR